jgi:hypothetical protein
MLTATLSDGYIINWSLGRPLNPITQLGAPGTRWRIVREIVVSGMELDFLRKNLLTRHPELEPYETSSSSWKWEGTMSQALFAYLLESLHPLT